MATSFNYQESLNGLALSFQENQWTYEQTPHGLSLDVEGQWSCYTLSFVAAEDGVRITCRYADKLPSQQQHMISYLLQEMNNHILFGHVALDVDTGHLYFSYICPEQGDIHVSYAMSLLERIVQECDFLYPLWNFATRGGILTREVISTFLFDHSEGVNDASLSS